jgi:hypothetical protein
MKLSSIPRKIKLFLQLIIRPKFILNFFEFNKKSNLNKAKLGDIFPFFDDATKFTSFDTHYVYHPAWAARIIKNRNTNFHIDISSTLHFCSMLSAFIKTKFYDYRPANLFLDNLVTEHADLCNLHFDSNSINSLSCMHTIEHIGLGRYGDPIDPDGDQKAAKELSRVLAKNGDLLIVVPVGKSKIMFNAHRIYSYSRIKEMFSGLNLVEFSLIPDNAIDIGIIKNADSNLVESQSYGCGCFWFKK